MRRRIVLGLIFVLLLLGILPDQPPQDPISRYRFSELGWTVGEGLGKARDRLSIEIPENTAERKQLLDSFFKDQGPLQLIEEILAREIEEALQAEGINFPPVLFKIYPPPTFLVISPRKEIRLVEAVLLNPGLSEGQKEWVESYVTANRPHHSALVVELGGYALLPAAVGLHSFNQTVETAAHEWCHHYLYLFPLGRDSGLNSVNENTCTLVGRELTERISRKYESVKTIVLKPIGSQPNFADELHKIRIRVDQLLAQGKVEEAEAFMGKQRLFLSQFFPIRKLNQAYFAFYGSYGEGAAGDDPTAAQVAQLRAASNSLKVFLEKIRQVGSVKDFQKLLRREGIP